MTHGTQTGTLWQSRRVGWGGRWERGSGGREHWCIYGWFLLMYDRKPQSSVKQLSFNLKIKFKKTELVNTPAPFFFGVEVSPSPVLIFFLVSFLVCLFIIWSSVQFSSVAQSCLALCDPRNHSTSGLPVHHQLPESTQTHVHRVGNAIQPSHPLSFPSPAALNFSQHHGLFKWISSSHQVEFQLQHQSFQWTPSPDEPVGSPCSPRDSLESSPTPQFKSINSLMLSFLYSPTLTSIHDHWRNHSLD